MREALRATGRPICYSINPGDGSGCPPQLLDQPAHDRQHVAHRLRHQRQLELDCRADRSEREPLLVRRPRPLERSRHAGGRNNGINDTEGRADFSMWAIMAAPLIAGNDLRHERGDEDDADIQRGHRRRSGVRRAHRGAASRRPARTWRSGRSRLTARPRAVALFNRGSAAASITVQWSALGIPTAPRRCATSGTTPISDHSAALTRRRPSPATGS